MGTILRDTWRARFEDFAGKLEGMNVYVTIDMDCLRAEEAATNWENGRFEADDLIWALGKLREHTQIVGGDMCGAFSEPKYARWTQKFAANWDHPQLPARDPNEVHRINFATLQKLWPALVGVS